MEINKSLQLSILSGAPRESPSAELNDQGASIPFRRRVKCLETDPTERPSVWTVRIRKNIICEFALKCVFVKSNMWTLKSFFYSFIVIHLLFIFTRLDVLLTASHLGHREIAYRCTRF